MEVKPRNARDETSRIWKVLPKIVRLSDSTVVGLLTDRTLLIDDTSKENISVTVCSQIFISPDVTASLKLP
jgi:hypothetical protein